jgi:hypothetical protein
MLLAVDYFNRRVGVPDQSVIFAVVLVYGEPVGVVHCVEGLRLVKVKIRLDRFPFVVIVRRE